MFLFFTALILLAVGFAVAVKRPADRPAMLFGALATVPMIIAELLFSGAINRLGNTVWKEVMALITLTGSFLSLGALTATTVNRFISPRLNPSYHPRRHRLSWLSLGSGVSVIILAFGQSAPVALMIGLVTNGFLLYIIDQELVWDAAASSLSFAVLFVAADLIFGVRTSGDIQHLLLGPSSIGLTIAGLPLERLLTSALIGALIGPLFSATKSRRSPHLAPNNILTAGKVSLVATMLIILTASTAWATNAYILPPTVTLVRPSPGGSDGVITGFDISFNRPIERQSLDLASTPATEGAWTFDQPDFGDHGYRKAHYEFTQPLPPATTVSVFVRGIQSTWRMNGPDYSFQVTTTAPPPVVVLPVPPIPVPVPIVQVPEPVSVPPAPTSKPAPVPTVPVHQKILSVVEDYQDQPLSCEAASLKMALAAKGVRVSETQIMNIVGYDPTPHTGNIWGDPHSAFVGNIAGSQNTTGYGVYWEPIARAAKTWRSARVITNAKLTDLTAALDSNDAVVVWGTVGRSFRDDWKTPSGKSIVAWHGEHARTLIGYKGLANAPTEFILNDPVAGRITWTAATLSENWARFGNSGVVVE